MRFRPVENWPALPEGYDLVEVAGVAVDEYDRIYLYNRGRMPVMIFNRAGTLLECWGEGVFCEPHGIVTAKGNVYCVDYGDHTVRKFTASGTLLLTIGTPGHSSDTGAVGRDWTTVVHAGPPFNAPTDIAVTPSGDLLVSDGYANARVHCFSPEGSLKHSWGELGSGPMQFSVPHSICLTEGGRLYISDRENRRIQILSAAGDYLGELSNIHRPDDAYLGADGFLYVAELGYRSAAALERDAPSGRPFSRISVLDEGGSLIHEMGSPDPQDPVSFVAAHSICMDSVGDLYVADAGWSAARGRPPVGYRPIHKLARAGG